MHYHFILIYLLKWLQFSNGITSYSLEVLRNTNDGIIAHNISQHRCSNNTDARFLPFMWDQGEGVCKRQCMDSETFYFSGRLEEEDPDVGKCIKDLDSKSDCFISHSGHVNLIANWNERNIKIVPAHCVNSVLVQVVLWDSGSWRCLTNSFTHNDFSFAGDTGWLRWNVNNPVDLQWKYRGMLVKFEITCEKFGVPGVPIPHCFLLKFAGRRKYPILDFHNMTLCHTASTSTTSAVPSVQTTNTVKTESSVPPIPVMTTSATKSTLTAITTTKEDSTSSKATTVDKVTTTIIRQSITPTTQSFGAEKEKLSTMETTTVVGIAIGSLIFIAVAIVCIICIIRLRRERKHTGVKKATEDSEDGKRRKFTNTETENTRYTDDPISTMDNLYYESPDCNVTHDVGEKKIDGFDNTSFINTYAEATIPNKNCSPQDSENGNRRKFTNTETENPYYADGPVSIAAEANEGPVYSTMDNLYYDSQDCNVTQGVSEKKIPRLSSTSLINSSAEITTSDKNSESQDYDYVASEPIANLHRSPVYAVVDVKKKKVQPLNEVDGSSSRLPPFRKLAVQDQYEELQLSHTNLDMQSPLYQPLDKELNASVDLSATPQDPIYRVLDESPDNEPVYRELDDGVSDQNNTNSEPVYNELDYEAI